LISAVPPLMLKDRSQPRRPADGCVRSTPHSRRRRPLTVLEGAAARKDIDQPTELGDLDTADLFTEVSRGIDKWLWLVEAHLQTER
jgi:hypothetical protein